MADAYPLFIEITIMKKILFLISITLFLSCQKSHKTEKTIITKSTYKESKWVEKFSFLSTQIDASGLQSWGQWQQFVTTLKTKPANNRRSIQNHASLLVQKTEALSANIPQNYNTPATRARLAALLTQFQQIEMYSTLDAVAPQQLEKLFEQTGKAWQSLQAQWQEIERKKAIPTEAGEAEMLQALDTVLQAQKLQKPIKNALK